jgi:hypothetical protein
MTTKAAEERYEAQHVRLYEGRALHFFNPNNRPFAELPVIYGFNNGGTHGWMSAVLLAEDGTGLGGHTCSSEAYMPADLGMIEGTREDRHAEFQAHYPEGYRVEFIRGADVKAHAGLLAAYKKNQEAAHG